MSEAGNTAADAGFDAVREARRLLDAHTVMSLAVVHEGLPHAASLMYAPDPEAFVLYWLSDPKTRHSEAVAAGAAVAATIAGQYEDFTLIRGLQVHGRAAPVPAGGETERAFAVLAARFPFLDQFRSGDLGRHGAAAAVYRLDCARLTVIDNRRGFGFKATVETAEA